MNDEIKGLLVDTEVFTSEFVKPDQDGNLPEGTFKKDGYDYILTSKEFTNDEIKIALLAKQTLFLKSIKRTVFNILWLLALSVIIVYYSLSNLMP
ncbi:MAG: hypothetical protein K0R00_3207 [Herbinix sp.]|jgi:hypothetical protein|nr:hypothetical protein [Herbinix sp.]